MNIREFRLITKYLSQPVEEMRENFLWGTYGLNYCQELQWKQLKALTTDHIQAIISDGYSVAPIMQRELDYRASIV